MRVRTNIAHSAVRIGALLVRRAWRDIDHNRRQARKLLKSGVLPVLASFLLRGS